MKTREKEPQKRRGEISIQNYCYILPKMSCLKKTKAEQRKTCKKARKCDWEIEKKAGNKTAGEGA
jgi:hypothetical protein